MKLFAQKSEYHIQQNDVYRLQLLLLHAHLLYFYSFC